MGLKRNLRRFRPQIKVVQEERNFDLKTVKEKSKQNFPNFTVTLLSVISEQPLQILSMIEFTSRKLKIKYFTKIILNKKKNILDY